jgi:hypothetical protein
MSFSARKPTAHTAPSPFTAVAHPHKSPSGTVADGQGMHQQGQAQHRGSNSKYAVRTEDLVAARPQAATVPRCMVPAEAPGHGVWYDGNPFEQQNEGTAALRGSRGIAEGAEGGACHSLC